MGVARREVVSDFLKFMGASPTPFHAVQYLTKRFGSADFTRLRAEDIWRLERGGKYFLTLNSSSLFAFTIGGRYCPGNGFSIVGAHTDSPCLTAKPKASKLVEGLYTVAVQTYGGGLWHTWFDRDLSVAGRMFLETENGINEELFYLEKPICCIPSLAIHLNRDANEKFTFNKETQLAAVLCSEVQDKLNCTGGIDTTQVKESSSADGFQTPAASSINQNNMNDKSGKTSTERVHPGLLNAIIASIIKSTGPTSTNYKLSDLLDFEMMLVDSQKPCTGGLYDEFIFSARLDNLFNTFCAAEALVETCDSVSDDVNVRVAAMYNHEEIGSRSAEGAGSMYTVNLLRRICSSVQEVAHLAEQKETCFERSIAKSFLLSADQAHACHPNYAEKHERDHKPRLHGGVVIKTNVQQCYATNARTAAVVRKIADTAGVPLQEFCVRQDSPCGSTIGPILAARLGIASVDVGGPMLAMHSIREMTCVSSVEQTIGLFKKYYETLPHVLLSFNGAKL